MGKYLNKTLEKTMSSGLMLTISYGALIGWTIFRNGREENWNLDVTDLFQTVIHTVFYVFAMIGTVVGMMTFQYFGTKTIQILSTVLAIVSGLGHLSVAQFDFQRIPILTLARCLGGFGFGIFYPGFVRKVSEQCYKMYRGRFTLCVPLGIEIGIFLCVLFQYMFRYQSNLWFVGFWSLFLACASLVTYTIHNLETFVYHLLVGDHRQAFLNFSAVRETHTLEEIGTEFKNIEGLIVQQPTDTSRDIDYLAIIYVGIAKISYVLVTNAFIFVFIQRITVELTDTDSNGLLIITMWLPRMIISFIIYAGIDRIGRKIILMIGAGVTGILFIMFGIVETTYFPPSADNSELINVVLYVLFLFIQCLAGVGLTVIPDVLAGEIIPFKQRKTMTTLIYVTEYFLSAILTFAVYWTVNGYYGKGVIFIWGPLLILSAVATKYLIFETKTKSLTRIWNSMLRCPNHS